MVGLGAIHKLRGLEAKILRRDFRMAPEDIDHELKIIFTPLQGLRHNWEEIL